MSIIDILVFVLLAGLLFWAVRTLSAAFGLPAPIVQLLYVILVVGCVFAVLQLFGLWSGPTIRLR